MAGCSSSENRLGLFALTLLAGVLTTEAFDQKTGSYFPELQPPSKLWVAKTWSGPGATPIAMSAAADESRAEMILMQSLSGLLLKQSAAEGIYIEPNRDHQTILQDLVARRTVKYVYVQSPATPWTLVERFRTNVGSRYVRCHIAANPDSLNIARMAAYKYDAVIVDASIETAAKARNLSLAFDASNFNDQWFYTNWWPAWPLKSLAVEQNNDPAILADVFCLNDYAAATGVPVFFDGAGTTLRKRFLSEMPADSVLLGWPHFDELAFTEENSLHNKSLGAANWSFNLALLSSFRKKELLPLKQNICPSAFNVQSNKHYVTFVFTDGDNIQWFHNGFLLNTQWWGSPVRGQVPVGWGISPCMRDLSPTIVESLFSNAGITRPATNTFVAMSPIGYCYPSLMSAQTRATNAIRLAGYMRDMDLSSLVVLDKSGFENPAVYDAYLAQPQIAAILYWDAFGDYAKYRGAVVWRQSKPIVSAYTTLWGANGPDQVASLLNQRPRNPFHVSGYSMVAVHAWSHSVESIRQCIRLLHPHVEVVTPDVFIEMMKRHAAPAVSIDRGDAQAAPYGKPSTTAMTISPGTLQQSADGSPVTRFMLNGQFAFSNMDFPQPAQLNASETALTFDVYGDGSGSVVRLELWSHASQGFLYFDLPLDFTGWQHRSLRLDGTDGLKVWNGSHNQVADSIDIWQVSGSWNGIPAEFFLDNVLISYPLRPSVPALKLLPGADSLRIGWSAEYANFHLETTTNLSVPWSVVSMPATRSTCDCETTISRTAPAAFYRLARQQ